MLIQCDQPAVTEVQGTSYQFRPDDQGRFVCEVHNLRHIRVFLAAVEHYKEADPDQPAVLTELSPDTAEIGGADVTLTAIGTGFKEGDVIIFNGGEEPTTIVDDTSLTTLVKPSTATVAGAVPVLVRRGTDDTAALDFTFTEPVAPPLADPASTEEYVPPSVPEGADPIPVTEITGIGAVTATKLEGEGISDARQLAALTPDQVDEMDERLALGGKLAGWVEQAQALVA
jgi:predicted flap endonuclease-1-like 5' DNA nuclease